MREIVLKKNKPKDILRMINPSRDEVEAVMSVNHSSLKIFARIESKTRPLWFNFGHDNGKGESNGRVQTKF